MNKIIKLRDMLCEELEKFGEKPDLNMNALDTVDKLAHAIKNIDKVLMAEEGASYADGDMGGSYRYERGPIYRDTGYSREGGSYNRGGSYARGRGSDADRDSMGRYSSHDRDSVEQLRQLMAEAPNERMRQSMQSIIDRMERG